jgi:hypothetical protein
MFKSIFRRRLSDHSLPEVSLGYLLAASLWFALGFVRALADAEEQAKPISTASQATATPNHNSVSPDKQWEFGWDEERTIGAPETDAIDRSRIPRRTPHRSARRP